MATVNTLDKYIGSYELYKMSRAETKQLEFNYRYLERNLTQEDLDKLISLVPTSVYERIRKQIQNNTGTGLPWDPQP